jgi:hypothetical protein
MNNTDKAEQQMGEGDAPRVEFNVTRVRIFQEPTGRWHISNDDLPHLDARGTGYPTRAAAVKDAKYWGWTIVRG